MSYFAYTDSDSMKGVEMLNQVCAEMVFVEYFAILIFFFYMLYKPTFIFVSYIECNKFWTDVLFPHG